VLLHSPQSEIHGELVEEVTALAREVLAPVARAGAPGRVNRALVRALGEHGLLRRLFVGYETGRPRVSALDLCLLRESLARGSTEAETAFALQGLGAYPLVLSGQETVVAQWLSAVARGEAVAAFALTEPTAGSDAAALELEARRVGGGYRLTGVKTFISNAPEADVYTIFARTTPDAGARGVTAFVLPGDADGLTGRPLTLISAHPIGRLELDGVFVPDEQVLGEVDRGFRVAMGTLDLFRPSVGAFALGMAQAALDAAIAHADTRRTFGRALREHQAVAHTLAEMTARLYAARLLVHAAAHEYDAQGPRVTLKSAIAKLTATETAQWIVDQAVQLHGAAALEQGHLLEHLYRDVRAPRIYEGASEIQRTIIARDVLR
jgi:acyl-CoA dehydrogenase